MDHLTSLITTFQHTHERPPAGVWAAPGRVNLIGEHTDYNNGYVMPFALAQQTMVAAARRGDESWTVYSTLTNERATFTASDLIPGMGGWQAYVAGVVWALRQNGHRIGGADLAITSTVPVGAGLSSSAALECGVLTALTDLYDIELTGLQQAIVARQCENEFVGAPTGLMDQASSILCRRDHALFLDCKTLEVEQVPLRLAATGYELLVVDTNTPHQHVDGEYAQRRESCDTAAQLLGLDSLRDVQDLEAALGRLTDATLQRRVRHVVTENQRVLAARDLLSTDRVGELGPVLDASDHSMRDDFEITVPTVELATETARNAGAIGARMTGGGFGGCIIAVVRQGTAEEIFARVEQAFVDAGFTAPQRYPAEPSEGARRL